MSDDQLQIRSLVDQYAICMDAADVSTFETLWAPDGVLEVFEGGPDQPPTGKMRAGKHFHFAFERLAAYKRTIHHVTTHHALVDGEVATGVTCCEAHHIEEPGGDGAADLVMHIRYEDRFVRHDGLWHFEYRKVGILLRESRVVNEQT